jgi:hypothetical protein
MKFYLRTNSAVDSRYFEQFKNQRRNRRLGLYRAAVRLAAARADVPLSQSKINLNREFQCTRNTKDRVGW